MKHVISCYTNCFGPGGVWEAAEQIRQAGVSYLEVALRPHNFGGLVIPEEVVLTERSDHATVSRFRALLERHGVGVSGCNIGGADLRAPEGLAITQDRLRCARKWFDVDVVVSGAGQPADAEETQRVIRHLRQLGDTAAELGVTVAFETHKGPTQNAAAMLRLMEDLDHPALRLNFDTGNIAYYNTGLDPVDELAKVVGWVANVHLKDNRGQFEDWYFPAIGDGGHVDFRRVLTVLDDAVYQGACTIEIEGIGGEPEPGPELRLERIRRSAAHLREAGYFNRFAG